MIEERGECTVERPYPNPDVISTEENHHFLSAQSTGLNLFG